MSVSGKFFCPLSDAVPLFETNFGRHALSFTNSGQTDASISEMIPVGLDSCANGQLVDDARSHRTFPAVADPCLADPVWPAWEMAVTPLTNLAEPSWSQTVGNQLNQDIKDGSTDWERLI